MITLFHITGCMIYVDPWGKQTGYEDVFTKIAMCRQHYAENGLGAAFVEQFISLSCPYLRRLDKPCSDNKINQAPHRIAGIAACGQNCIDRR